MATYAPESTGSRKFEAHPAGKFSATLCDVYAIEEVNSFCGKAGTDGKIDDRATVLNLYLCFLTDAMIEMEPNVFKPRWIRQKYTFSLGKNANLTKTLKGWIPELAAEENLYATFGAKSGRSIDTLIGTPAYITITHTENKRDASNPYTNVVKVDELPKFNPTNGKPVETVEIPAEFKRGDVEKYQAKANSRIAEKNPSWRPAAQTTAAYNDSKRAASSESQSQASAVADDDLPF